MKKKHEEQQQSFCQLLDSLSVKEYRELHNKMGITKKMLSHTRNTPTSATYDLIEGFAKALNMHAIDLIDDYSLGVDKITVREYKLLEQKKASK